MHAIVMYYEFFEKSSSVWAIVSLISYSQFNIYFLIVFIFLSEYFNYVMQYSITFGVEVFILLVKVNCFIFPMN